MEFVVESKHSIVQKSGAKRGKARKAKPTAAITNNGGADIAQQCLDDHRWTRVFIPTLTHTFYISREPFLDWALDSSTFITTVQHAFDLSFPNVSLVLRPKDLIVSTVRAVRHIFVKDNDIIPLLLNRLTNVSNLEGQSLRVSFLKLSGTSSRWMNSKIILIGFVNMFFGPCGQVGLPIMRFQPLNHALYALIIPTIL